MGLPAFLGFLEGTAAPVSEASESQSPFLRPSGNQTFEAGGGSWQVQSGGSSKPCPSVVTESVNFSAPSLQARASRAGWHLQGPSSRRPRPRPQQPLWPALWSSHSRAPHAPRPHGHSSQDGVPPGSRRARGRARHSQRGLITIPRGKHQYSSWGMPIAGLPRAQGDWRWGEGLGRHDHKHLGNTLPALVLHTLPLPRDPSIWDSSQAPCFLAFVLNQSCVVFVLGSTDVF